MAFDQEAWLKKLDKVQTTAELTALVMEIPLDDDTPSTNKVSPEFFTTAPEIASTYSTLITPIGKTQAG